MKVVGYVRVSSTRKSDHEPSAAEQKRKIRAWAKEAGHTVIHIYSDEGVSGANGIEDREELTAALDDLRNGKAAGLVFAHMDRLSRKLHVQEAILAKVWESGARVFSADVGEVLADDEEDPYRTAMRQMMGVFAQLERGMIRARLTRGKRIKRAAGGYAGGFVPLGQRVEGREFVPDAEELRAVERIKELRSEGKSYREIVAALGNEGIRPRKAEHWSPATVRNIALRGVGS